MLVHNLFYDLATSYLCGYDLAHVANFLPCIITTHSKTPLRLQVAASLWKSDLMQLVTYRLVASCSNTLH